MTWTSPQDVVDRWINDPMQPDALDPHLAMMISDAEDAINAHFKDIQARIDSEDLPIQRVHRVVARMVITAWKIAGNPLASFQQTTGPFSVGGTYDAKAKKHISLSGDDIKDLSPKSTSYNYFMTYMGEQANVPGDTGVLYAYWPPGWLGR
jgi:hypothetical protein